jgi:hypothetical protein
MTHQASIATDGRLIRGSICAGCYQRSLAHKANVTTRVAFPGAPAATASVSGKRDFPPQRQLAQNRLQAEKGLRGDQNAYVEARQLWAFG